MTKFKIVTLNVLALLAFTYMLNNCSIPFSGAETGTLKLYEHTKKYLSAKLESYTDGKWSLYDKDLSWSDSITLINTSFDQTLVDYYGDRDFPQGKIAITDRRDLYDFLKIANQFKEYKYIILDVALDNKGLLYDDSLALLISQMNNITVARSEKYGLMDALSSKAGWVDYYKMPYETGFTKYIFGTREKQSLALRVYNERNNKNAITSILGIIYFDGLRLCQRNAILDYDIRFLQRESTSFTSQKKDIFACPNLGTDFYDSRIVNNANKINNKAKVRSCIKNNIVVLGDFLGDDVHDTYVGKMPGVLINLNAYLTLQDGGHLVNLFQVILLFFFYFSLYIIKNRYSYIKEKISFLQLDFAQILIGIIGWGFFFNIVALILYVFFDTLFNPWLPTLWFTFIPQCVKLFKSLHSLK